MARGASQQKHHWSHWEESSEVRAEKGPRYACPNDPGPQSSRLFLSLPSCLSRGPWTYWYGRQPSAQHTALRAVASILPNWEPAMNTATHHHPLPPEGSGQSSCKAGGGPGPGLCCCTRSLRRTMTGASHCCPVLDHPPSSEKCSGKRPPHRRPAVCTAG